MNLKKLKKYISVFALLSVIASSLFGSFAVASASEKMERSSDDVLSFEKMIESCAELWSNENSNDFSEISQSSVLSFVMNTKHLYGGLYPVLFGNPEIGTKDKNGRFYETKISAKADTANTENLYYRLDAEKSDIIYRKIFGINPDHTKQSDAFFYDEKYLYIVVDSETSECGYECSVVDYKKENNGKYTFSVNIYDKRAGKEKYKVCIFEAECKRDIRYGKYWKLLSCYGEKAAVVVNQKINLKKIPRDESKTVAVPAPGTEVEIISYYFGWYEIKINSVTGYCKPDDLLRFCEEITRDSDFEMIKNYYEKKYGTMGKNSGYGTVNLNFIKNDLKKKNLVSDFNSWWNSILMNAAIDSEAGVCSKDIFSWPLIYDRKITSSFGVRSDPIRSTNEKTVTNKHSGIDIAVDYGTYIIAAADGIVSKTGTHKSYGKYVKIKHNDRYTTFYAHCSTVLVSPGEKIKKGQIIAQSGSSGIVTGPHLHFEVRDYETRVDPMKFFYFIDL